MPFDRALVGRTPNFGRAIAPMVRGPRFHIDTLPDLGVDIGSKSWWQGFGGCAALCALTIALAPGFRAIPLAGAPALAPTAWEESRVQAISPLAWGADSGRRMAATDAVQPLIDTPERPRIDLTATLGEGDSLSRALQRAGVAGAEAARIADQVSEIVDPNTIAPGTALSLTLGRRASRTEARPVEALDFRARFDMKVAFARDAGGMLAMRTIPIAIDSTPLRVDGLVGESLYASARAAGAPGSAVQTYIRALAPKVPMDAIGANDRFSLIVEQQRAATGEVRYGKLLYVGLDRGNRSTRMIQWTVDGDTDWFDAAGVGRRRGGFQVPVAGARKTSGFGWRLHPLLGYSRLHQGTDYGAAYGTPIRAVSDGVVTLAGWHGGHGKMVKLNHAGGLGSGYAHMSRIAVTNGARVTQGQVIGYVGSTGLSTGPHLHLEVYRGGTPVNPSGVRFESTPLLSGAQLAAFKAKLAEITATRPDARQVLASR